MQDEPCSGDWEDTSSLTAEDRILIRLKWLRSKANFTDLAFISDADDLMDPLLYHEFKCHRGMFYNSDDDSDLEIERIQEFLEYENFSSESSDSDSDGFY